MCSRKAPKLFFSNVPSVNQQRTLFDMSKVDTRTINVDYYYPNYKLLVCPGDTVIMDYSALVRMLDPLQVPMMDNLYCDVDFWYVAFDNVWEHTYNFFGQKKRPSDPNISTLPLIQFTSSTLPQQGSVYDYFNIPVVGTDGLLTGAFDINALPLMSYYLIHDDWIMDEQRQDYLLDTPDFSALTFAPTDFALYKRGKRFDYFTSTTLLPQSGSMTTINLEDVPVYGTGQPLQLSSISATASAGSGIGSLFFTTGGNISHFVASTNVNTTLPSTTNSTQSFVNNSSVGLVNKSQVEFLNSGSPAVPVDSGLYADMNSQFLTVEAMRRAFQVQAYKEQLNKYGTRYPEYIYSMYGTIAPDDLCDRSEFLGRVHFNLQVQPIVQQSGNTAGNPLGNLGGICSGGTSQPVFSRSFTKFGYIIGCINIYADLTYFQGLEKDWQLRDRMDFPLPIFANLTDQPVYKSELVLTGTSSDDEVFGYNEIYAWAKYSQNTLAGLVRPNVSGTVGYYSLAEKFSSVPVNDDLFIEQHTPIDNITNVGGDDPLTQHFIVNQKFNVKLTRELPMHSDPMKWMFRY